MGRAWEEAASSFFHYIRGWTLAEFSGKGLPFLSSVILEAGIGLDMGRGCLFFLYWRLDIG
jgi:hypothetical protein